MRKESQMRISKKVITPRSTRKKMLPLVVPDFLSATEVAYTLLLLTNSVWYPCPMQEAHWPMKRCTKLNVSRWERPAGDADE